MATKDTKKAAFTAYNVRTKQTEPMKDPRVEKTARGGYILKGTGSDGTTIVKIVKEADALAAIKAGTAKKAFK